MYILYDTVHPFQFHTKMYMYGSVICHSSLKIRGWTVMVLLFKWNFFGRICEWYHLFRKILHLDNLELLQIL